MSISSSGRARRSFMSGSRLWPPAISLPTEPWSPSRRTASSTDSARSYANDAGITGATPSAMASFGRPADDRLAAHDRPACPDGAHDRLVARAPAVVAMERVADLAVGRVGHAV